MAQHIILASRALGLETTPLSPPPFIHQFLNVRKSTVLQSDCDLYYAGNNIYLVTSFCIYLLQVNILEIPNPGDPTGLSPLLTPRVSRTGE